LDPSPDGKLSIREPSTRYSIIEESNIVYSRLFFNSIKTLILATTIWVLRIGEGSIAGRYFELTADVKSPKKCLELTKLLLVEGLR
jgi:hypothetical protein